MEFKEFIEKLASVLRGGSSTIEFTRSVFEAIVANTDLDILDGYKSSSFKGFYNGKTSISGISKKINAHLEPMEFSEYISNHDDGAVENLCSVFKTDIPDIELRNAGDKLAELFESIIIEAAGKKRKTVVNAVRAFNTYLDKAFKRYSCEKTLLDPNNYCNITDFYISNSIKFGATIIENPTVEILTKTSNHLIIQGTAGSGKSTLLKYLFIKASESVSNSEVVPILVAKLNRYRGESIIDFVLKTVQEFDSKITLEEINSNFSKGSLILLIDGIDEIKHEYRVEFNLKLESFLNNYDRAPIIITSRPIDDFMQYSSFIIGEICPFTIKQSLAFVEKQKWDDVKKQQFIKDIKFYYSHELNHDNYRDNPEFVNIHDKYRQFISNPLLLIILLITYTPNNFFPEKRIKLYQKIYETLAKRHDSKKGIIKEYHTHLSFDDFYDCFAEFCALTYEDNILEFGYQELKSYTKMIKTCENRILAEDFIADLKDNICLIRQDGDKYYFIHRSFQEYFAAVHYLSVIDNEYLRIVDVFKRRDVAGDETLTMLYEMNSKKVRQLIFRPFLEPIMALADVKDKYKEYLKQSYHSFTFDEDNHFVFHGYMLTSQIEFRMFTSKSPIYIEVIFPGLLNSYEKETTYDNVYDVMEERRSLLSDRLTDREIELIEKELYSGEHQVIPFYGDAFPPISVSVKYVLSHQNQYCNLFKFLYNVQKCYLMREYLCLEFFYENIEKEAN